MLCFCVDCQENKPPYQDVLESRFLTDAEQACCFEFEEFQYELNFTTMTQTNMKTKTKLEVCRRPCFLSELDLKTDGLYALFFCVSAKIYYSGDNGDYDNVYSRRLDLRA